MKSTEISFPALEKFMNSMGLSYDLEIVKSYRDTMGRKSVCISIVVYSKEKNEYDQVHCYSFKNGNIVYDQGNEIKGINQGVLSYLGQEKEIDNYFDNLARIKAKSFFEEDF